MKMRNIGGRPTVEESKRRSYSVNIRVNSQELAMLRLSAKEAGIANVNSECLRLTNQIGSVIKELRK